MDDEALGGTKPDAPAARPMLTFSDAVLYAIALIVGLNWPVVAAADGPASLPLWLLAMLVFFAPLGLASAELTQRCRGEGGVYAWVRDTLGPFAGFLCGWCYWISGFPAGAAQIFFISSLILHAAGIAGRDTPLYLAVSLLLALTVLAIELSGLKIGKWFTNIGGAGTFVIFGVVIVLAALSWRHGATDFVRASYVPTAKFDTAILWGTMVFAYGGAETLGFLRNEIAGGVRTILKVLIVVGVAVTLLYVAGTVAILTLLPPEALTRLAGLADALAMGLRRVGLADLAMPALVLVALSYFGGNAGWFGVYARLPFAAGIDHFLPDAFARRHPRTGAPTAALLLQGTLTIVVVVLGQAGETAASTYDLLVAMSVLTSALPYVFIFLAWFKAVKNPAPAGAWTLPVGIARLVAVAGFLGTVAAIVCALVPSGPNPLASFLKVFLSTTVMLAVGALLYVLRRPATSPPP